MTEHEKYATGLIHSTDELRKLLLEHPNLPLIVFANNEANLGDYRLMSCGYIHAEIGEFLDCCQTVNDERCYTDRDEFEEDIYDSIYYDFNGSDEDLKRGVKRKMMEYNPYWKPCIILCVGN